MHELLTVPEVAEVFRVNHSTIYRWLLKGKLESLKINGIRRIPARVVSELINGGR